MVENQTALAIDIGSNAMRCAVGKLDEHGDLKIFFQSRAPVSIGRAVFNSKERLIDDTTIQKTLVALNDFIQEGKKFNTTLTRAVATSAMRDAQNSETLIDAVKKELNLTIQIISGDEEARLVRLAVSNRYDVSKELLGILDIGGGSAEFNLIDHGTLLFAISERVGTIRLLQAVSEQRISKTRFTDRIKKVIDLLAQKVEQNLEGKKLDSLLATGGNVEELGKLRTQLIPGKKKSNKIRLEELETIITLLEPLTPQEREKKFGFRPDRADVILPAAIILREILVRAKLNKIKIPGVGLREGVLLELLSGI
jgi:exopolyphosphatase/guanosine-5'-triphosphate,3'-diphosphate pyrophosphatase